MKSNIEKLKLSNQEIAFINIFKKKDHLEILFFVLENQGLNVEEICSNFMHLKPTKASYLLNQLSSSFFIKKLNDRYYINNSLIDSIKNKIIKISEIGEKN